MSWNAVRSLYAGVVLLALTGCANSDSARCKLGADCPSGVCNADGTCEPVSTTTSSDGGGGAASQGGGGAGAGGSADGGGGTGAGAGGSGGSGVCAPNDDGVITAAEIPIAAGLTAKFRVASNATFDTSGDPQGDGSRVWDFTPMLSGDHTVLAETLPIEGSWYAADFAGATYATTLSDSSDLLGVFELKGDGLYLRGVVSPEDGFTATNLNYDPPVKILAFPMKENDTWETTSTVSGLASGVASFYTETYSTKVDAHGKAVTPFSDFQVLRIGTDLTRVVGAFVTTTRTYAYVTECFGTIARVVSQTDEIGTEFTDAAEVRRLTP